MFTGRNRRTVSADEAFEHYVDWRQELSTCEFAYRQWATARSWRDSAIAFAAYGAALDREEEAAARYATAVSDG